MPFYIHLPTIYLAAKFVKLDRLLLSFRSSINWTEAFIRNVLVCNNFLGLNLLKFI